jgi:hypothetical protein
MGQRLITHRHSTHRNNASLPQCRSAPMLSATSHNAPLPRCPSALCRIVHDAAASIGPCSSPATPIAAADSGASQNAPDATMSSVTMPLNSSDEE